MGKTYLIKGVIAPAEDGFILGLARILLFERVYVELFGRGPGVGVLVET